MRLRTIALATLVAALVPAFAVAASSGTTKLSATLTGGAETPKGAAAGKGSAAITLNGSKVCWSFTGLAGIDKPAAAHIHKGKPGTAGPVVVPFGGTFKASGCTTAPAGVVKAIVASPGSYYVNVHTAKFPAGAVRGQLKASTGYNY